MPVTKNTFYYLNGPLNVTTFYGNKEFKIKFVLVLKVKVTLVQALRLCTGRTAHRGSRGIALL